MTTPCPSEDDLVRLVEGALADASLASIEQHLDGCVPCAAVVAGLGALRPAAARVVGRYQLDRRIAAGGMGEVWAAWDPTLRRDIAVKLVRPDRADDGRERERLLREARALARLQHPNVLAVYDVGLADGDVFLATELVAGDTLASRGGATGDWRALVRLYAQAARGLAAAHAAGLVHRDVKPANLLLGADGRVRVADFGLAVHTATPSPGLPEGALLERPALPFGSASPAAHGGLEPPITASGHVAGTPAYMAPEQRLGLPADARADQFALCLALVEGIDGRRPTADLGADALIAFVTARRTPEPALAALCRVVARGLSGIADERHPDMTALADALDQTALPFGSASRSAHEALDGIAAGDASGEHATLPGVAPSGPHRDAETERSGDATPHAASATGARRAVPRVAIVVAAAVVVGGLVAWRLSRTGDAPAEPTANERAVVAPLSAVAAAPVAAAPVAASPVTASPLAASPVTASPVAASPVTATHTHAGHTGSAAIGAPPSPAPPVAPTSPATSTVDAFAAIDELGLAVRHRDARRCRDVVDAIDVAALDRAQQNAVAMLHARCDMIGGDCAGGSRRAEAVFRRLTAAGAVARAVEHEADWFCPVTGDAATVKRRLLAQTSGMTLDPSTCRAYVAPARKLAAAGGDDTDRRVAGSVLVAVAKCFSIARQCDDAHALLREADALVHGLDNPGELTSACQ